MRQAFGCGLSLCVPHLSPTSLFLYRDNHLKEASEKAYKKKIKVACNEERQAVVLFLVTGMCKLTSDDIHSYKKGRPKYGSLALLP